MKNIFPILSLAFLTACVMPSPAKPPMEVGAAAGKPDQDVAILVVSAEEGVGDHVFVTSWAYWVEAINGVPVERGVNVVRLPPGQHTVKYRCFGRFGAKDTDGVTGAGEVSQTFMAGNRYYGSITKHMHSRTIVGNAFKYTGRCEWTGITTKRPRL